MGRQAFSTDISRHVWDTRYRWRDGDDVHDLDLTDTWRRVARALAAVEAEPERWEPAFFDALSGFRFLPGGRILAGAGTDRAVTLFNCFVMGVIPDDMAGIFRALEEGALTMQQGGGIGMDFSTLRPRGTLARASGAVASGPVSFMRIWDATCATILSTGARRGAMMATLRCDHPDIGEFVAAKATPGELSRFNLSVQVTDDFMRAVRADQDWPLVFPADGLGGDGPVVERWWTGGAGPEPCRVVRVVRARALWDEILRHTWEHAEPGVLFVDRIQALDNLGYRHRATATNPCGEIPLQPYGACNLGSIDLTAFVREPFTPRASLDLEGIAALAGVAVRMLDDVVDVSRYPLPAQAEQAHGTRRIGLGITGLANALILLGLRYDAPEARDLARKVLCVLRDAAWRTSTALSREKGPFPFFDERFLDRPFVRSLSADIQRDVAAHGARNSHLLAIAPTGTISLLADNVSSGIEPVFSFRQVRRVLDLEGRPVPHQLSDKALAMWEDVHGDRPWSAAFVTALELPPLAHLEMQAAVQPFVDNAISKTINVPEDADFADFRQVYDVAWERGLKGVTTFRPNPVTGSILEPDAVHCCTIEREDS